MPGKVMQYRKLAEFHSLWQNLANPAPNQMVCHEHFAEQRDGQLVDSVSGVRHQALV